MGLHNVPLQQLKHGMAIRAKRSDGERIRDTVTMAKEDVLSVINANVRALQEQFKRKKSVLVQMTAIREQLREDLRNKVSALAIDNQCSKMLTRPHSARIGQSPTNVPAPAQGISKPHFRRKNQRDQQRASEQGLAQTWGSAQGW